MIDSYADLARRWWDDPTNTHGPECPCLACADLRATLNAGDAPGHATVGPLCKRGHERAVYERFYARKGSAPARRCMACQHDSARARRQNRRINYETAVRARVVKPDSLSWTTFCANIVNRIEAVRRDDEMRERIERRRSA